MPFLSSPDFLIDLQRQPRFSRRPGGAYVGIIVLHDAWAFHARELGSSEGYTV